MNCEAYQKIVMIVVASFYFNGFVTASSSGNPRHYEVAIIGAGSAGLMARSEVVKKTENYIVIDSGMLGTTCARVGCMPSKAFIQIANDYQRRKTFTSQGILGEGKLNIDSAQSMQRVRRLRDRFVGGMLARRIRPWQTPENFSAKSASFIDQHTIDLGDEVITANKIIIASGSTPLIPDQFRGYEQFIITSDEFFELEKLPLSMAIVGAGYIGLELGQALSSLNVDTLLIARRKSLAGITDPMLLDHALNYFSKTLNISTAGIDRLEQQGDKVVIFSGNKTFKAEKVLIAAGRVPAIKQLKLENLGISLDAKGMPEINPSSFSLVEAEHISLVGDVTGKKPILHEAKDEGAIAGRNSVNSPVGFVARTPLSVVFSEPNICFVGKRYSELESESVRFVVGESAFTDNGRALIKSEQGGIIRVYVESRSKEILGGEMMGIESEHIAHLLAWVIEQKLTVNKVLSFPFYHPSLEEALRAALRDAKVKMNESIGAIELSPS